MKFTFSGCSFTALNGQYASILKKHYTDIEFVNLAVEGNSNHNIFMTALHEALFDTPDVLFVQWSALNRLWAYPTPLAKTCMTTNGLTSDVGAGSFASSKNIFFTKKELIKFGTMYNMLNHDYNLIRTLVEYIKILEKVTENRCRLVYINGLLPWTEEILSVTPADNLSSKLSDFTKSLIDFDKSPDDEIIRLLQLLQKEINTINKSNWVNMFDSMIHKSIDGMSPIDPHPGPITSLRFANLVKEYLEKNSIVQPTDPITV